MFCAVALHGYGILVLTSYKLMIYRQLSAKLRYLQCISNEDTAVMHQAVDVIML